MFCRKKHSEMLHRNVSSGKLRSWVPLIPFIITYRRVSFPSNRMKGGSCWNALLLGLRFKFCNFMYTFVQWSALKHVLWMMWRNENQPKVYLLLYFIRSFRSCPRSPSCTPTHFCHLFNLNADTYSDGFRQFYDAALLMLRSGASTLNGCTHVCVALHVHVRVGVTSAVYLQ